MFCNDADIVAGEYHMHSSGSLQEAQSIEVAIQAMVKYANSTECRRAQLLRYFDEVWPHNECASCDNCLTRSLPSTSSTSSSTTRGPIDFTAPARLICQAVYFSGERFGFGVPLALLRGSKAKAVTDKEHFFRLGMSEMPCFGKGVSYSDSLLKSLARLLVSEGVLVKRCIGTFSIVILGESGRRLVSDLEFQLPPSVPTLDVQHHWMQFQRQAAAKEFSVITRQTLNEQAQSQYSRRPEQLLKARQAALDVAIIDDDSLTSAAAAESDPLVLCTPRLDFHRFHDRIILFISQTAPFSDVEVELLAALVSARKAEAHRLDQAPYSLCSQPVLELIVRVRPTSAEALESIPGLCLCSH
jgi:superfamily II DNA helicase RecQ